MAVPNRYPVIIDIEASGFGPSSYPIEVGVILEDRTKYCALIMPSNEWTYWDKGAEEVHHISQQSLFQNGQAILDVAKALNRLLKGKTIYSDGWVVDRPWLQALYAMAGMSMSFRFSALEMILTEQQLQCWDRTKAQVINDLKLERHRATNDALIVQETYSRTLGNHQSMAS